jgi:hypothetical protein
MRNQNFGKKSTFAGQKKWSLGWLAPLFGLLVACGGDSAPTDAAGCKDNLCLPVPESGFQMRTDGETIQPGSDVEYCEVLALPGGPDDIYYVNRFEVGMTEFSHHLIVSAIEPGSSTDKSVQVGDKVPCTGANDLGEDLWPVTGSQQPYNDETFPEGVGRVYYGGQKLIFDYHYYNTSARAVSARAAVNFHQTTEEKVERYAVPFGMYNLGFNVPVASTVKTTTQCNFNQDAYVFKLTRHTHRWGKDFDVWYSGGPRDGEHIFKSEHFEDVDHVFDEPVLVKKGEGFRFTCEFKNTESYELEFGLKATDEMCILFGTWFVTEDGQEPTDQSCFKFDGEQETVKQ